MNALGSGINWLKGRLHYLVMWPVNLIRDFPRRLSRLLRTAEDLVLGLFFLLPELLDAWQHQELGAWLRFKIGRMAGWLNRLFWQLFDLVGGPEIVQFFLYFFTSTSPLTAEEIKMMAGIVGQSAMRFNEIRVAQGGLMRLIFRLNGNLAFAAWHTVNFPAEGRHTRDNRAIVAHELTHVYQYEQIGSRYLGEAVYMLVKTKRDCYDYGGYAGLEYACASHIRYDAFNREQQAMIVQDYVTHKENGRHVDAYEPFILDLRTGNI